MREDEKQALISRAEQLIKHAEEARDDIPFGLSDDVESELALVKIALSALIAEPVGWGLRSLQEIGRYGSWLASKPREKSYLDYQPHKYENVPLFTTPPAPSVTDEPVSRGYTLPDGFKLVPVVPTDEMLTAGDRYMDGLSKLSGAWEAMLNAAPEVT